MTYYYPQDQFLPEFDQRQFGQPGQPRSTILSRVPWWQRQSTT